jgi:hypothetical protein
LENDIFKALDDEIENSKNSYLEVRLDDKTTIAIKKSNSKKGSYNIFFKTIKRKVDTYIKKQIENLKLSKKCIEAINQNKNDNNLNNFDKLKEEIKNLNKLKVEGEQYDKLYMINGDELKVYGSYEVITKQTLIDYINDNIDEINKTQRRWLKKDIDNQTKQVFNFIKNKVCNNNQENTDNNKLKQYDKKTQKEIIKNVDKKQITETDKEALVKIRINQSQFREQLIKYWGGCSVTKIAKLDVLIASHIKPWSKCDNDYERLDEYNGLLLIPNLDKLFDRGHISFDDDGKILISNYIDASEYEILGINESIEIKIEDDHKKYLKFHRDEVFKYNNIN